MEPRSEDSDEQDAEMETDQPETSATSVREPPNAFEVLMSIRPSHTTVVHEKATFVEDSVEEHIKAAAKVNKKLLKDKLEKMSENKNKKRLNEDDGKEVQKKRVKKRVVRVLSSSDSEGEPHVNKSDQTELFVAIGEDVKMSVTDDDKGGNSLFKSKRAEKNQTFVLSDSDADFQEPPVNISKSKNRNPMKARQTLLKLEPVSAEVFIEENLKKRNNLLNYFNTVSKEEFDSCRDKIKVSAHIHSPPSTPGRKSIPPELKSTGSPRRSARAQLRFESCDQIELLNSEIINDLEPLKQLKSSIFRPLGKSHKNKPEQFVVEESNRQLATGAQTNKSVKLLTEENGTATLTSTSQHLEDNVVLVTGNNGNNVKSISNDSYPKIVKHVETRKKKQKLLDVTAPCKEAGRESTTCNGDETLKVIEITKEEAVGVPTKSSQKKKEQPAYLKDLKLRIKFPSFDALPRTVSTEALSGSDVDDVTCPKTSRKSNGKKIMDFMKIVKYSNVENECVDKTGELSAKSVSVKSSQPRTECVSVVEVSSSETIVHEQQVQICNSNVELMEAEGRGVDTIGISASTSCTDDAKARIASTRCFDDSVKNIDKCFATANEKSEVEVVPSEGNLNANVIVLDNKMSELVSGKEKKDIAVRVKTPRKKEQPAYLKDLKLRIKFPGGSSNGGAVPSASKNVSHFEDGCSETEDRVKTPHKLYIKRRSSSGSKRLKLSASKIKSSSARRTPLKKQKTPSKEFSAETVDLAREKSAKVSQTEGTPTKSRSTFKVKSALKASNPTNSKISGKADASSKETSSVKDSKSNRSRFSKQIGSPTKAYRKANSPIASKTSIMSKSKMHEISETKSPTKGKGLSTHSGKSSVNGKTLKRLTTPTKEESVRFKRSKLPSPVKTNSLKKLMSAAKKIAVAKTSKSTRAQGNIQSSKSLLSSKSQSKALSSSKLQSRREVVSSTLTKSSSKEKQSSKSQDRPTPKVGNKLLNNAKPAKPNCRKIVRNDDDDRDDSWGSGDNDYEESDDDVIIIKSKSVPVKKVPSKLAPLFVKTKSTPNASATQKPVDPEILAARMRFLNSGVPDCVRKTMELISVEEPELSLFPAISHVQQKDSSYVWHLPAAELTLLPVVDFPICVPLPLELGVFTDRNGAKQTFNLPKRPSPVEEYRRVLNNLKISNPDCAVFRCFKTLREKNKKAVVAANPAAKAVEKRNAKRVSKRKRSEASVEIVAEVEPPPEDAAQVWTEKYKPISSDEVVGNADSVQKLKKWLESWKKFRNCDDPKYEIKRSRGLSGSSDDFIYDSFSDEENESNMPINTALLFGPCGAGKTSSVYAVANELGFKVLEINASSKRTGKCLSKLQEATQSHRLCTEKGQKESCDKLFKTSDTAKKQRKKKQEPIASSEDNIRMSLILVENADIVFEDQDEGFLTALAALSQSSKRPLVLIANDPDCPHLARYHEQGLVIEFTTALLALSRSSVWLQLVCLVEGINLSRTAAERLVKFFKGDLSRCLLHLQFWALTGGDNLTGDVPVNDEKQSPATTGNNDLVSSASWASDQGKVEASAGEHERCVEAFLGREDKVCPYPTDLVGLWWNLAPMLSLPQVVPHQRVVVEALPAQRNDNNVDGIMADMADDDDDETFDLFNHPGRKNNIETVENKVDDMGGPSSVSRKSERKNTCSFADLASLASLLDDLACLDVISSGACEHASDVSRVCMRVWERDAQDGVSVLHDVRPCRQNRDAMVSSIVHWVTSTSVELCAQQLNNTVGGEYDITLPDQANIRWLHEQWQADNMLVSLVPANTVLNRHAMLASYSPFVRSVCRSENRRLAANTKRRNRFFHYFRSFGLHLTDHHLNVLCATFSPGVWKCGADAD